MNICFVSSYFTYCWCPCKTLANPWYLQGNLFSFYELCRDYKWTIDDEKVRFSSFSILTACDTLTCHAHQTSTHFQFATVGIEFPRSRAHVWWQVWSPHCLTEGNYIHQLFGWEWPWFCWTVIWKVCSVILVWSHVLVHCNSWKNVARSTKFLRNRLSSIFMDWTFFSEPMKQVLLRYGSI